MKERPILFSAPMVKAILDGQKTMTRRVHSIGEYYISDKKCPYGVVGDRLWVRETWYYEEHMHDLTEGMPDLPCGLYSHRLVYKADCTDYPVNVGVGRQGWCPSIFMPRWASRILLEVTDIKVERLQDITEEDLMSMALTQQLGQNQAGPMPRGQEVPEETGTIKTPVGEVAAAPSDVKSATQAVRSSNPMSR